MKRFEAVPNRSWRNTKTGQTASIFGSHPSTSNADDANWLVVQNGYTIRDNLLNRVGGINACPTGSSQDHAEKVADMLNEQFPMKVH